MWAEAGAELVRAEPIGRRPVSIVELALRAFAPVEAYLRRCGFSGFVVKWGDEIQIPTRDLRGTDPLFAGADVVRFVSLQPLDADSAANKDRVGVDQQGRVTAFIPRRPLEQMEALAERGLLQRRSGTLYGGVNLGSVAVSRALADVLLEEFAVEVNDAFADRKNRPDLDPQSFTALSIAVIDDAGERERAWALSRGESAAIEKLASRFPDVLGRLRRSVERFRELHGSGPRFVAMVFGGQYWGDVGQHHQMYAFYRALAEGGPLGQIARGLAGLPEERDERGNIIGGRTRLGPGVDVRNSVLLDARIDAGTIEDCVLVGTHAGLLVGRGGLDIESTVRELRLEARRDLQGRVQGRRIRTCLRARHHGIHRGRRVSHARLRGNRPSGSTAHP